MQLDMHYYGVYALAKAAGLKSEAAQVIATASQFVDDNAYKVNIKFEDGARLDVEATAHHASDIKNIDEEDQRQIWVPFHFLPGNEGDAYTERLICRKDSEIARKMVGHHLSLLDEPYALELMGITAHVYGDTFSHYGFSGVSSRRNKIANNAIRFLNLQQEMQSDLYNYQKRFYQKYKGEWGELDNIRDLKHYSQLKKYLRERLVTLARKYAISLTSLFAEAFSGALGHGAAVTFPDQPFLHWQFEYEFPQRECQRKNLETFLEGCEALHDMFSHVADARPEYADSKNRKTFAEIKDTVTQVLQAQHQNKAQRTQAWQEAARNGALFSPGEAIPTYDKRQWLDQRDNLIRETKSEAVLETPVYRFYRAASIHRVYILRNLLPEYKLVVA